MKRIIPYPLCYTSVVWDPDVILPHLLFSSFLSSVPDLQLQTMTRQGPDIEHTPRSRKKHMTEENDIERR